MTTNQKVLRDEKVRAENQISAADTIMEELLERMAEEPSSDAADGKKVDTLLEGACKLMALCEAANDEDVKRYTRNCTHVWCVSVRLFCICTWLKCLHVCAHVGFGLSLKSRSRSWACTFNILRALTA